MTIDYSNQKHIYLFSVYFVICFIILQCVKAYRALFISHIIDFVSDPAGFNLVTDLEQNRQMHCDNANID